uniref:Pheromone-binding protein 2 n=1 Tax=Epiphyas postvittana TaxID=65032 RepID=PBP2_EPIPO|nr:RecName: Full=Pheromone-binding protein 2; Short=PBP 2; Flags: Precursor [Epiphyas postvittana]AAL09026.1 pheromone binding protein [Epiphyas postvittana]
MMNHKELVLFAVVCLSLYQAVEPSQDVVKDMSLNFRKGLDACKKELNLPDTINSDFNRFWNDDHVVTNRDTGCAIMCLSSKLELVSDTGLHHGNTLEYAKQHGADDTVAQQIVDLLHSCAQAVPDLEDPCLKVLEWAKCFKAEIHKLNWAPSAEVMAAEMLAEV